MFRQLLACLLVPLWFGAAVAADAARPNVILIITDDQGYGDLGFHGNPKIRTPNLDRLAKDSVQLTAFHVMPVCSPTRACLMTGRYNYRTGVVDTYVGRSLMHPDEMTIAEILSKAGYRTGIFGKWHLGDNYPMRPIDQGFQEALVLRGGGLSQPADLPGNPGYFDSLLQHNGKQVKAKGYCSDVFTDAAIQFIEQQRGKPFFVYLAYNAPHTPLELPESYLERYRKMNLKAEDFPATGNGIGGKFDPDVTARVYGMVTNIDDNLGRLFKRLDELKLAGDTLVVFLTDNGPQQPRYNAGMLQRKGNVHDGGIRVPCFIRWPGKLEAGRKVERIAAHIDLTPTILDACGAKKPEKVAFDGKSLLPLLRGDKVDWPDRTLYFQWHRGDEPQLYRSFAARSQTFKLVQPQGVPEGKFTDKPDFKLYDMSKDPFEMNDLAAKHPEIVAKMKKGYEDWFKDVSGTRGYAPPRIHLGAPQENPSLLTRQDWRGPRARWGATNLGHWEVEFARPGIYSVRLLFPESKEKSTVHLSLQGITLKKEVPAGVKECVFERVPALAAAARLEAWLAQGSETVGVHYVEVTHLQ